MLATFVLNLIYFVASGFLSIFPVATISDEISDAVSTASGYLSALNVIAPITTLLAIISIFLTIEGIILTIKIINWFIRKIPGVN